MSAKESGKAAFEAAQLSLPDWQRRTATQVHYHYFCAGWDAHREQQGAELDRLRAAAAGVPDALLAALKFHPSASHVSPDFRDLFNKTLQQHFDHCREYAARTPKEPGSDLQAGTVGWGASND